MSVAIVISARDNVATALEPLEAGQTIRAGSASITVVEPIPRGHKVALQNIAAGDAVVKYGSPIGTASSTITPGTHVHTHNLASTRGRGDLRSPAAAVGSDEAHILSNNRQSAIPDKRMDDRSAPRIAEPPELDDQVDAAGAERS